MKKVVYVLLDILAAAFLIGGYIIQYFAKRKLGMVRWLNYNNMKMEQQMPVQLLKYGAVGIVLILVLAVLVGYRKKREVLRKSDVVMIGIMSVLWAVYCGFTAAVSPSVMSAYYYIMPMIGAATLLLVVRNLIAIGTSKYEK